MTIDRLRFAALLPAFAAGCLLLAACSSNSTPGQAHPNAPTGHISAAPSTGAAGGGADPSADPCALLTQAEVDTAAGQSLGPGERVGALDDCQWSTSDFAGSVELDVADWSALQAKSTQLGQTLTAVPGVGDEALALNLAGNAAQLYVRKGTTGFLLLLGGAQYIGSLPDLGLAQEKTLAAAVLGRL